MSEIEQKINSGEENSNNQVLDGDNLDPAKPQCHVCLMSGLGLAF